MYLNFYLFSLCLLVAIIFLFLLTRAFKFIQFCSRLRVPILFFFNFPRNVLAKTFASLCSLVTFTPFHSHSLPWSATPGLTTNLELMNCSLPCLPTNVSYCIKAVLLRLLPVKPWYSKLLIFKCFDIRNNQIK